MKAALTRSLVLAAVAACFAAAASGHEVRPAYLEIRETSADTFDVVWKVPLLGDLRLALDARLPPNCVPMTPVSSYDTRAALVERWTVACDGGMIGGAITIDGLQTTLTDVLVRMERADGTTLVTRLSPSEPSFVVEAAPSRAQVAKTYLGLGVEHILLGIDHLLFVLALLIIVKGWKRLIGTVTAFTVAHSLTLAAATLGFVHVPQRPVEAVIALSILFLATEIIHARQGRPGMAERWPWVVAFIFGLLHGFGFAGALAEVGLPDNAIPVALLFFNVGVEVGQLLFIAGVAVVWMVWRFVSRRVSLPLPEWAWQVPAYAIGTVAAYWTVARVVGFWA